MDDEELYKLIDSDKHLNGRVDVLACDELSADPIPLSQRPQGYIINTDEIERPIDPDHLGEHWVTAYVPAGGSVEYFDSFALEPWKPQIRNFLRRNSFRHRKYKRNTKVLQDLKASTCGYWCIYYLYYRFRGMSMSKIMKQIRQSDSDCWVFNTINQLFKNKISSKLKARIDPCHRRSRPQKLGCVTREMCRFSTRPQL